MEIAIIAHDRMKADMVQFLNKNRALLILENITLIATGTTGTKAENAGFKVQKMLSGPLGGDAQIAARVAEGIAMYTMCRWLQTKLQHNCYSTHWLFNKKKRFSKF